MYKDKLWHLCLEICMTIFYELPSKFVSWWEVHKLVDLTTLFELGLKAQGLALEKFLFHG